MPPSLEPVHHVQQRLLAWGVAALVAVWVAVLPWTYPATDDWVWFTSGRSLGPVGGLVDHWLHWGGRWSATLLLLGWGQLGAAAVWLYPLAGASVLAVAWWTARHLATQVGTTLSASVLAGLLLLTWLRMPSTAEGVYWLSGSWTYALPWLVAMAALLRPAPGWLLALLGLVCGGASETSAVLAGATGAGVALLGRRQGWWLTAGCVVGLAIAVSSPGTRVRMEALGGGHAVAPACVGAVTTAGHLILRALMDPLVAILGVLALRAGLPVPGWRGGLGILAAMVGGLAVAILPSLIAVGFLEGRQLSVLWGHAVGWVLVAVVWLGARWPARCGQLAPAWLLLTVILQAGELPDGPGMLLLHVVGAVVATALAGLLCLRGHLLMVAPLVLAAWHPAVWRAAVDATVHAPLRRIELARRDAAVARLVAEGHARLRLPLADPQHFPATISVGDVVNGASWQAQAWAAWHGVAEVRVDPRLSAPQVDQRRR